jgi:hypothetical protein
MVYLPLRFAVDHQGKSWGWRKLRPAVERRERLALKPESDGQD